MSDLTPRSWIFLVGASVLDVLTVRGLAPFPLVAGLVLLLGLALQVEWFVPGLAAAWALVSVPLLVAFGVPEATRNRVAVFFLVLMTVALIRLILDLRQAPPRRSSAWTSVGSTNGQRRTR
jgi:hypothetical protein